MVFEAMDLMIEDTQRMKMKASFHDDDSTHALFAPPNFKMAECPLPDGSNKIVCRSRHAVKVKAQNIYHSLFKALSENEARSGEDRKQYSDKFKEVQFISFAIGDSVSFFSFYLVCRSTF